MTALVVYHLDTEQVRMIVSDAANPNDPAWFNINNDPDGHAIMQIERPDYDSMTHDNLQAHHVKHIPLHKAWYKSEGHKHRANQKFATQAFRTHLASINK